MSHLPQLVAVWLFAVGLYGKVLPNHNGAPLRLVVPWKYGFKCVKSLVKIRFTDFHDSLHSIVLLPLPAR